MYVQCKQGFVEVDRYDGSINQLPTAHLVAISKATATDPGCSVMVVRSREKSTLEFATSRLNRSLVIFRTPSCDYEFRIYVTLSEWVAILAAFSSGIDYRNFKNWAHNNSSIEHAALAHGVWHEATLLRSR